MNLNIGILCSGNLGFHCLNEIYPQVKPQFIFTDKNSTEIIEYAEKMNIPFFVGNPRNENSLRFVEKFQTDLIFSINYLFIVNQNILMHVRKNAINFHGSLLPKYRGRTPHVWTIINGEKETGITAHFMEEGCDTGDIVLQEKIIINPNFSGADILEIFKIRYPVMIMKILDLFESNNIASVVQEENKATYFGKRIPEDGKINWDWQKERIHNWVRAQAYPYPGAFTFLKGEKIIIDKISFSDIGFNSEMHNGLIIETTPNILVKTPNGVVELVTIRNRNKVSFIKNNLLN